MSDYRVKIPLTVTVPVRSQAKTKDDAVNFAVAAIHRHLPWPWLELKIDQDAIVIDELKDDTPYANELLMKAEG